jgi:dihydroorotase-like cyclic amidohydrolase
LIKDGKIIAIGKNKSITPAKTIDAKGLIEARGL